MTRVRAISINSDVYCLDYGAMKLSKNVKFVTRKLSVSSRQNKKLSVQFELSWQFV